MNPDRLPCRCPKPRDMRKYVTLKKVAVTVALAFLFFAALPLHAQIVAWQFGVPASTGDEVSYTATTNDANLSTSTLTRGAGISATALARGFSANNFPNGGTKADAITNNRYFQFTVSAVSGYQTSLSTLDCRLRRTTAGPNAYIWRYSTDGSTFTDIGSDISFTSTADGVNQTQIDLSGIGALQNVASGTTITLRLYAWGATATTGTFAIGRYGASITTNSLAIGGTVTPTAANTSVFFAGSNLTVNEDDGTADLTVSIDDFSTTNATSVDVVLSSGNAARVNGFSSQTVNWAANDGADKTVTLTLTDDMLCNGTDLLTFGFANLSGGDGTPFVGSPSSRTVTVNDDETTVDPVATAGTNISTSGFDANWSNIGATTYFLDVSRYSDFMEPATTDVVLWNFPAATNDNIADGGIAANAAKTLTAVGAANLTFNSAGNGGLTARADGWNGGDGTKYWQVELETTGYGDIKVSSKQRSSNTGPRDFKLQYRIGTGGAWVDVSGGAITVADNYTTGALNALSLPAACADQGQIFLRWVMTSNTSVNNGTVAAGGASNMDDVLVTGRAFSYVGGYDGFDAGSATSESLTGLLGATTYHYRVRATGGCASAVYSNTISVTTDAVDTYYSRATGNVNDPIWSDTPSGTAGPAVWTNASNMVVQSGDDVTVDANTTTRSVTVANGATLNIDANRWIKTTAGTNTINGTLNAADNSEFRITEGTSATLALGGTASFWDFRVGMTTGVTVTGNMHIRGTLQIDDGDFDCTGASVVLRSTAAYTGRLGPVEGGASYTGNLKMERHIPEGNTNWRLLGSPIQNRRVIHWQDDFFTAGYPGSQFPTFSNPPGSGTPWPSIRWYDETDLGTDVNDGLIGVSSQNQNLLPGQGFAVWCGTNLDTTYAFTIDLENNAPVIATTPITLPMTYTNTGEALVDGWNLVANPLPSAIAFDQINRGADVEDYITYYNPANGNTAVWDIGLNFGTNDATNTIQSMQGFFLKASGSAVTTTVEESHKVNDNSGGFFGGLEQNTVPALRLHITSGINTFSDEAAIIFHEGTPGLDANDVQKFVLAAPTAPQIATLAPTGTMIAINAHGSIAQGLSIPVSVNAGVTGQYTITLTEQGDLGLTCITLEDLVTGAIAPMNNGASYTFQLDAAADASVARFMIHATAPALLYAEDATCGGTPNGEATIVVQGGPHDITWYNGDGDVLLAQMGIAEGVATITGLDAGTYTVSVSAGACAALTSEFSINAPFVLEAQADAMNASCADAADGTIDLLPLGGVAPYSFLWNDATGTTTEDLIASPGLYAVTITDANGCIWVSEGIAIGSNGPVASIMGAPETVLVNTPVNFESGSATGEYFWSFGDGASSSEQNPTHTYTVPGTYTVVLSVTDGLCSDVTTADITVELSTSIAEAAPATHRAWATPQGIAVQHAFGSNAHARVELVDATGRVVLDRRMTADRVVLPVDGLSNGVWFVRLSNGEQRTTLRVPLVR